CSRTGGGCRISAHTKRQIEQRCFGRIEARWIKVRALVIDLEERRVIADAQSIVESQLPTDPPLIRRIRLKDPYLGICDRPTNLFSVGVESGEQGIGIRVARITERRREAAAGAEAECPRPVSAGRFPIQQALEIGAEFVRVLASID